MTDQEKVSVRKQRRNHRNEIMEICRAQNHMISFLLEHCTDYAKIVREEENIQYSYGKDTGKTKKNKSGKEVKDITRVPMSPELVQKFIDTSVHRIDHLLTQMMDASNRESSKYHAFSNAVVFSAEFVTYAREVLSKDQVQLDKDMMALLKDNTLSISLARALLYSDFKDSKIVEEYEENGKKRRSTTFKPSPLMKKYLKQSLSTHGMTKQFTYRDLANIIKDHKQNYVEKKGSTSRPTSDVVIAFFDANYAKKKNEDGEVQDDQEFIEEVEEVEVEEVEEAEETVVSTRKSTKVEQNGSNGHLDDEEVVEEDVAPVKPRKTRQVALEDD